MNLASLTEQDWQQFVEQFPHAHAFLWHATLKNDYRRLAATAHRTWWQENRYQELHALEHLSES